MTPTEAFVNEFCNHTAVIFRGFGRLRAWYLFGDKREGSPTERIEKDSANYAEYSKLFQS